MTAIIHAAMLPDCTSRAGHDLCQNACSATWFQRGQQVRTQAAVKLDPRATLWGT